MSARTWDVVLFMAALLCAAGFARYYVTAVLAEDRSLARAAAVGFVVLGVVAVISFFGLIA